MDSSAIQRRKQKVFDILRDGGRFWSYDVADMGEIDDNVLMEKGLMYLDLEDMHLLTEIYGERRLRQFWRERFVPQGEYLSILNWILAIYVFHIKKADRYLKRYGRKD